MSGRDAIEHSPRGFSAQTRWPANPTLRAPSVDEDEEAKGHAELAAVVLHFSRLRPASAVRPIGSRDRHPDQFDCSVGFSPSRAGLASNVAKQPLVRHDWRCMNPGYVAAQMGFGE